MATPSEILIDALKSAYEFLAPVTRPTPFTATALYYPQLTPTLDRLPAFVVYEPELETKLLERLEPILRSDIENGKLNLTKLMNNCNRQIEDNLDTAPESRRFRNTTLFSKGDVTMIAAIIFFRLKNVIGVGYGRNVQTQNQHNLGDHILDRLVLLDEKCKTMMEDKSPTVFAAHAQEIVNLATSDDGKKLVFQSGEVNERAIIYTVATTMFAKNIHWGVLFGGDKYMLFHRVPSEQPTRYGIVCSPVLPITNIFTVLLVMLLDPGNLPPLVDTASYAIPAPAACLPDNFPMKETLESILSLEPADEEILTGIRGSSELNIEFTIAGYEHTLLSFKQTDLSTQTDLTSDSPPIHMVPDEHIHRFTAEKSPILPFLPSTSFDARHLVPTIHVYNALSPGGTGLVYPGVIHAPTRCRSTLIIKAVPPRWKGKKDLYNEAIIYETLISLQGSVIPRTAGFLRNQGWTILIAENCGSALTDDSLAKLPVSQKHVLWKHVCAIHVNGVVHNDLEPRNIVVSSSGDLRIIDFAFSRKGHECDGECRELGRFRKLLKL